MTPAASRTATTTTGRSGSSGWRLVTLAAGLGAIIAGCAQTPPSVSRGAVAYDAHCAMCHGPAADGAGALADRMGLPAPGLRALAAANGGVFPRDMVAETVHGYPGKHYAGSMPEFGPLLAGPMVAMTTGDGQVIATPRMLVDLLDYLETLQDG